MSRFFSPRQKKILSLFAGNKCELCGIKLNKIFHGDHKKPYSKGGLKKINNGQALCPTCNYQRHGYR